LFVSLTKSGALLDGQRCLKSLPCVVDVAIGANEIVGGEGKVAKGKGKVESDNDEFHCGLSISGFRRLVHP